MPELDTVGRWIGIAGGVVVDSVMRGIACAGLLAGGLLIGAAGAGVASADTGESGASGGHAETSTSKPTDDTKPATDGRRSTTGAASTAGAAKGSTSDRADGPTSTGKPVTDPPRTRKPVFSESISIAVPRLSGPGANLASGWPAPPTFSITVDTIEISIPTLNDVFRALQPAPPTPTPHPTFRGEPEEPTADAGGGVVATGGGVPAIPRVVGAPVVAAPPPVTGMLPAVPAPSVPAAVRPVAGTAPAVVAPEAGATISGPTPPGVSSATMSATPNSAQPTRLGPSRYLSNPTVAELTIGALPGLAAILAMTFSGGLIGYRQANSLRFLRVDGAERFLR